METPNTGVLQSSLQQQLKGVDFVFKSLDDKVTDLIQKNMNDLNNIPLVLIHVQQMVHHFFDIMKQVEMSSMELVGLEIIKQAYCDYKASMQLICISFKNINNSNIQHFNDLKQYEKTLSENFWYFKTVKEYISQATRLSFQSSITSRFNYLLNGGNAIIEKSKIIENLSHTKTSSDSMLLPPKQGTEFSSNPSLIPNRPRSISPCPNINDQDSRLLDLYSLKKFIDVETLMDIYHKFDEIVLLVDFRPSTFFKQNHISLFSNIVNIEPLSVKPHYNVQDILDHSLLLASTDEQIAFSNMSNFELVIILDQSSIHAKLSQNLLRFITILDEKNTDSKFKLKRKPIILDGGFDEWSYFMNNQAIYSNTPRLPNLNPILINNTVSQENYIHTQPIISRSPSPTTYFTKNMNDDSTISIYNESKMNSIETFSTNSSVQKLEPLKNPNILIPITNSNGSRTGTPSPVWKINDINSSIISTIPEVSNSLTPVSLNNTFIRSSSPNRSPILISGLTNLGNSCYMNSALQCMMGTKELTNYLLQNLYQKFVAKDSKLGSRGKLTNEYQRLAKTMLSNTVKKAPTNPKNFKKVIAEINNAFNNCDQQDSAEFLHFILDTIHEDLNWSANKASLPAMTDEDEANREVLPVRLASTIEWEKYLKTDYSSIIEIFAGQYASRLECGNCHKTSTTYIPFNMLSVPIPKNIKDLSVYNCIDEFTSPELLTGNNAWKCPRCKIDKSTRKQLTITRLPRVLIIHLERFSMIAGPEYKFVKNSNKVDIPIKLNMKKYWPEIRDEQEREALRKFPIRGQEGGWEYQLYGVVRHYGTLNSGHYISEVKKNDKWVKFDDENVSSSNMGKKPENDGSAYILFYEKAF
jgi:ubiquitin carboxyl-terminal hydrolase 8